MFNYLPKRMPSKLILNEEDATNEEVTKNEEAINNSDDEKIKPHETCKAWLRENSDFKLRNFQLNPIRIKGYPTDKNHCSFICEFGDFENSDAHLESMPTGNPESLSIRMTMESVTNYPHYGKQLANAQGIDILMNTHLDSQVPVPYFSWAEYDFMKPAVDKKLPVMASAFISNCGASSFRLKAMEELSKNGISIDSFGRCMHSKDAKSIDSFGRCMHSKDAKSSKSDTIRNYKFHLAFENSIEEDYVTEKYFQSLVEGTVPVVIGSPNIKDYEPQDGSIIHVENLEQIPQVAAQMKSLMNDESEYKKMLEWKSKGPSTKFLALVDLAVVHSQCRLCIHVGTTVRLKEIATKHPECQCQQSTGQTTFRVFLRERGKFEFQEMFFDSTDLSIESFYDQIRNHFLSQDYSPIWIGSRKDFYSTGKNLKIYAVYPATSNQRDALYGTANFTSSNQILNHFNNNPCAHLEIIFT
ncbi:Glycosyl transferase, family 10 domain-containing protein [Rozella allomycis CSF55]|uniref:Fucosyltransferase n=1 Tax=Rozella allomycis (strain CSF55) TaxID=988480 RepID=A0A075ARK6_ROZAC|nr:Glycosyl transferase, family 10 domain-containing protein [Rozella allomycis CSF55]|eukprot:EPZ31356.1 Glycosyl transferase, family 10 domain-containing protein [Rozella allomycis CSF55]